MKTSSILPMGSTMQRFYRFLPDHIKARLKEWYEKNTGKKLTTPSANDWLNFWDEELNKEFRNSNILSEPRKREIIERLPHDIAKTILQKKKALQEIERKWGGLNIREIELLKRQEAWYSVNPTSSRSHYRFQIGFRNNGCKYWRDGPYNIGCLNCGYFFETFCGKIPVDDHDLIYQFDDAYETVNNEVESGVEPKFDVIEFLSDGSFLNDEEIPENVRLKLFKKINTDSKINEVLIETRPEYITKDGLSVLLDELTRGQKIVIAIGLESTDKFILMFCINKGYYIEDVEEALKKIAEINSDYQNRCSVLFYVLVKPAYLNESEALKDALTTISTLHDLMKEYSIDFTAKLEPVVVPQGTILDVLYHDTETRDGSHYYFPPSYWTILEIIARLEYDGMGDVVRIGAREDMDRYLEIPAIYHKRGSKKGMFSRYDFLIYEAVQNYNIHHNFTRTLIPLAETVFKDPALSTLDEWKEEIGIEEPFFMRYLDEHKEELVDEREQNREFFDFKYALTNKLVRVLNMIEYGIEFQKLAEEYQINASERMQILNEITTKIKDLIEEELGVPREIIKINDKDIALMQTHEDWKLLRMHIKILAKHNGHEDDRSIWIGIPTKRIHLEDQKQ